MVPLFSSCCFDDVWLNVLKCRADILGKISCFSLPILNNYASSDPWITLPAVM